MNEHDALLQKLHELYSDQSKHSVYQNIPAFVREALNYSETINERWRGDSARWDYLRDFLDFDAESILDVGANTGFFTLSLAHKYPAAICTALEGNANHSEFIQLVSDYFKMKNVRVLSGYLDMAGLGNIEHYDTILLFNVLHHAGVDFDTAMVQSKEALYDYLVRYMKELGKHCNRIILQMGYNWGGNKQQPVVALQDDVGKYIYTCRFLRQAGWTIYTIAASYSCDANVPVYHRNLPEQIATLANDGDEPALRKRLAGLLAPDIDIFSEFYRRPVFVCTR